MTVKPLDDVRQISALTYGFIASKALFAALDLDLFSRISGGTADLAALAGATGVAPNRLRTLLTALKTVGLVTETDGKLANSPAATTYLVAGAPGDFRDYINVVNGGFLYEGLRHLSKAMRGERIFPDKGFYEGIVYSEGGVGGAAFSQAQHAGSLGPAQLMARRVDSATPRLFSMSAAEAAPMHLPSCGESSFEPPSSTFPRRSTLPAATPPRPAWPSE